jgi:hypothetical protein
MQKDDTLMGDSLLKYLLKFYKKQYHPYLINTVLSRRREYAGDVSMVYDLPLVAAQWVITVFIKTQNIRYEEGLNEKYIS